MKIRYIILTIFLLLVLIITNSIAVKNTNAESYEDDLSSRSYVVMDSNGIVLYENNSEEKNEVASICKLMTTLLTLEQIEKGNMSLDDSLIASEYACAVEGSQAFLDAGSEYRVGDLLKSVIVASANDSAIVLGESIAGSENEFVKLMNARAKELGMVNTLYSNSTGLTNNIDQYSTAKDTAIILNEVSQYDIYREDCKIWMDELIHPSGRVTELVNTNRLIKYYPYCFTGKTGFTDEAGYCLSSTAIKDNLKLTCVVLGCQKSSDRFTDSVTLYNKAFANFKAEKIIDKSNFISTDIKINKAKNNNYSFVYDEDYYITIPKNGELSYTIDYKYNENLSAPISKGQIVGVAEIKFEDKVIDKINIITESNIEKQTYKDILNKVVDNYLTF